MDEFDEINTFGDEFRPDSPLPSPPPSPPPTIPPPPYQKFDGDFPPPPSPLMPGPSKTKISTKKSLSFLLGIINQLLTKYGDDPTYRVKKKRF